MKNSRRFLALMLAFLLAFGNLSTVAMAAEGEGAGIQQSEPVSAEAPAPETPPADAGTEAVPTEPVLEQAPAEPAQNAQPAEEAQPSEAPAEVPAEASSTEEAPASEAADAEMNEYSSAEAAPETEQPAAEPGVGGFKLPGVEVPEAPETEIVAPEPQADPSTNADNGIMPILNASYPVYIFLTFTGDGAQTFNSNYNNGQGYVTFGVIDVPSSSLPKYKASVFSWNDCEADPQAFADNPNFNYDSNGGINIKDGSQGGTKGDVSRVATAINYIKTNIDSVSIYSGDKSVKDLNLDYSTIQWPSAMRVCRNAAGYPGVGVCWHLDITINVPKAQATVTVNAIDEEENSLNSTTSEKYDVGTRYDAKNLLPEIEGYVFDHFSTGNSTGILHNDVTVTAVYAKDTNRNGTADKDEEYHVTYQWGSGAPKSAELPVDGVYHPGDTYELPGFEEVPETDEYKNVIGTWTFDGWKNGEEPATGTQTMGTDNVIYTGTWTYKERDKSEYNFDVSYSVSGKAPADYKAPETATYATGEGYTIAEVPASVDTYDEYDNVTGTYTFEGWKDAEGNIVSGEKTMVDADVEYTGVWTYTERDKSEYTGSVKVKYYFEGQTFFEDYGSAYPKVLSGVYGATVTLTPNSPVDYNGKHYVLDENDDPYTAGVPKEGQPEAVIEVHYLLDSDKDGVADSKEENKITIAVENGTADPTAGEHKAEFGKDFEITFTPAAGFVLGTVTVLGVEGAELTQNADGTYSYTFKNVTEDESISVVFVRETKEYKLNLGLDAINLNKDELRTNTQNFALNYTIIAPDSKTTVTGSVKGTEAAYKSVTARDNPKYTHKNAEYTWKDVAVELPLMPETDGVYTITFTPENYKTAKAFYCQPTVPTLTATFTLDDPETAIDVKHVEIVYGTAVLHFDPNTADPVEDMPGDVYAYTSGQFAYAGIPNMLPQREGYIFLGWADSKTTDPNRSYTWTLSSASGSYKFDTNNARGLMKATLYAVWAKEQPVTVTKTFVGLEEAPEGFAMTYKANADGTFYSAEGSLSIADATTGKDEAGNTTYSWTLIMPGETTSTVTKIASMNFSVAETGHEVEGYKWSSNQKEYEFSYVENATWNFQPFRYNKCTVNMVNTYVKQFTVNYFDTRDADKPSKTVTVAENGVAEGYTPTRPGYNFKGWATEPGGEVAYEPDAEIGVTGNMNLYGVWAYDQVFYGIVDGLTVEQVKSDAFKLSRNIKLADGTLIKFNKNDLDAAFEFDGTTTTIKWTVELPETAIGTKPTIAATDLHHTGYYQSDYDKVWNGLQGVDGGMPAPGASDVGLIYVRVRGTTSYQKAEGGTINVNLSKWDNSSNLGLSTGSTSLTEYWRACECPVGATAVADPGYVFKGWHKYYSNRIGDLVTPDPALTADNMKVNSATGLVETNQWFVPVFEKAEMKVEGVNKEYAYETFYPTVTFAGADGETFTAEQAGLTVQYSTDGENWSNDPIGAKHVLDSKTVQVQAVDASGNVVCKAQEVTLTVTPHPITVKSNDVEANYTANPTGFTSFPANGGNNLFFELQPYSGSGGIIGGTAEQKTDVGIYKNNMTFVIQWRGPQPGGRPGIYATDYDVTPVYGDLTINPRKDTVRQTLTVPYTGEWQSLNIDILGEVHYTNNKGLYAGERLLATLSALEPGIYTVKGVDDKAVISGEGAEFSYKILKADGETDSTGNYDITFDLTLIIVDAKQGVTMNDWTYGETPEEPVPSAPDFEGYGEPTYAYFDAEGNGLSGKPVNAGEYIVKATWTGGGLPELTAEADFTINKASVTIKPVDESKVYDGEELTASEYEFVGDGRFYGDDAGNYEFTYGGSQTEKGESVSTVTATLKDGAPDNYAIETQPGKLTIMPKGYDPEAGEITVSKPVDVVYNGQSQELEPEVTDGDKELVLGADYTLSYSGDTTNAGTVTVTVNFTGNYSGTATTTYKITVRDLSYIYITASVYNGQEQRAEAKTDEGLAYSRLLGEEPLVEGHKFTYLNGEKFYVTGISARQHNRSTNAPWKSNGIENFTIVDENGTDVSRNYNLKAMQTRLEITKAPLTVRAVDNSKVYGTDDPNLTYEVMEGTTLYDRDVVNGYITFAVTREKGENVGEYNMTVSYEYPNAAKVKESNYTVTCLSGTFEITPAPLTVTTYSASKVYDGRELTAGGEIKGLVDEADAILNVTGTQTDAGSSYNTYEVTFADEQMAKNYKLEVANVGTLVVAPSSIDPADPTQPPVPSEPGPVDPNGPEPKDPTPVWMGAGVDVPENVEYDGAEHQWAPTVRDQYGNVMVAGTDYEVGYSTNDFTNVTGEITVTITGKGNYGGTVTRTYEITPMAVVIPVAGHSATLQYNGATQQVEGFDASSDAILEQDRADVQVVLAEGVNALASARNVSESPVNMGLTAGSFQLAGGKAANYSATFDVTDGSITITPRVVTLTADSVTREYNGEPLTASGYTRTGDEFAAGEEPTVTVTGSQLIPGSSANVLTYGFGAGVESANYTVNAVNGTLTVTDRTEKYAIGMQPIGGTATYDGAPHSAGGFAAQSFTVEGKTYTVEGVNAGVTATNAGTYPVQITGEPIVRDAEGNDVTKQFNVTYGSASLTIGRKAVTVTANNAGKVYGTNDPASFTAAVTGLVGSDRLNYSVTREAGENVGTYAIIPGGAAVQGNYDVTYVNGAFTITSQAITGLTVNGPANVVYDGAAHQWTPTVTGANGAVLQAGRDYNVAYNTGNFTDAGTVNVTITGAGNYSGSVTRTYQITPRAVTLTSATATKVYDGAALTAGNVTAEGFVPGEGAAFNVTGGRTIVGTSLNTFTYTLNANTNAANYVIGQTFGTLTVTPAALAVNVPANTVYDGAAHQWAPTVTGVNGAVLQAGRDYNVAYGTGNFTDAGTVNVTITGAGNYTGTVTRAYTITPRAVTMTSASATKVYDGTALTAGNVTAQGFAPGEGATYNVTGGRTIVGTSLNTFTYTLNANTDADNYNISRTFGTLTVTPAALTVNVPANTVYDGAAHQWAPTVTGANGAALQAGRDYNVAYSTGNFTDAGTVNVTITGAGNYTGTVTRTYTITPRDVTLTSASATKVYDGTALTAGNVTAQGFAPGEGATYNVTGRRTIVGTSLNAFTYTLNANTDAGNYNISRVFGRLVVTQAEGPAPDEGPNGPGNGPDNGPDNDVNPDNEANTADITEDEVPLGGEPEIEAASEDIPEDDVPMGALPDKEQEYSLSEEVVISEDETPLGAAPTEADCCILHFILMLCALGVAVYYTYDRKRHQKREFELRSELK